MSELIEGEYAMVVGNVNHPTMDGIIALAHGQKVKVIAILRNGMAFVQYGKRSDETVLVPAIQLRGV